MKKKKPKTNQKPLPNQTPLLGDAKTGLFTLTNISLHNRFYFQRTEPKF